MTTNGKEGEKDSVDQSGADTLEPIDLKAPSSGEEQVPTDEKALGELLLIPDRVKRGWHRFGAKVGRR